MIETLQKNGFLAKDRHRSCCLCSSCSEKRNLDKGEAERNGKDSDNIEEGFRISGLGQLVEAGIQADRLITFGD